MLLRQQSACHVLLVQHKQSLLVTLLMSLSRAMVTLMPRCLGAGPTNAGGWAAVVLCARTSTHRDGKATRRHAATGDSRALFKR
jgi:hypothetical protein